MTNANNVPTETKSVSNYDGYDYDKEFWQAEDRRYEDLNEKRVVRYLLDSIKGSVEVIVDSGCGFGRLFQLTLHLANAIF